MVNYAVTKEARLYNGLKSVYSINSVGKTRQIHPKNETGPPSYTIYKNKLKID